MKITAVLSFHEQLILGFINQMAAANEYILRKLRPDLPLLYDAGVVYTREDDERFVDYPTILLQGEEDCDSLAPARAGELRARGWKAVHPGDAGYEAARARKPDVIEAECYLTTRVPEGQSGMYHVVVRYWIGGKEYRDDPSARLGMRDGIIDPTVLQRWADLGVSPRTSRGDGLVDADPLPAAVAEPDAISWRTG